MFFLPINIRLHNQGQGAPLVDRCTTVRVFTRDDDGQKIHAHYDGVSICPFFFLGVWKAVAITRLRSVVHPDCGGEGYFETENDGPVPCRGHKFH